MQYLSPLECIAQVRELTGFAHNSDVMRDLGRMISQNHSAVLDIGPDRSKDGRAHRAIIFDSVGAISEISYRDWQVANMKSDELWLQGSPINLPPSNVMAPIVLGSAECSADSSEIALNFARPFKVRLEVRCATAGSGSFVLMFVLEYDGKLFQCKSTPVKAQLSGAHQFLEFDLPEIKAIDPEGSEFLEAATFVKLTSVFIALGVQPDDEHIAIHSNWAFGSLPANYVL